MDLKIRDYVVENFVAMSKVFTEYDTTKLQSHWPSNDKVRTGVFPHSLSSGCFFFNMFLLNKNRALFRYCFPNSFGWCKSFDGMGQNQDKTGDSHCPSTSKDPEKRSRLCLCSHCVILENPALLMQDVLFYNNLCNYFQITILITV